MSENEKEDFYKLYGAFLELDERFALISGRARDIINQFYCWYNGLDLFTSAHKGMLLNEILGYAKKCEYTPQNLQQHIRGTTITPQDKKALDKARTLNQEAYKVYEEWRMSLGNNAKILAIENVLDRTEHYFSLNTEDERKLKEILNRSINDSKQMVIPRQFLMEFHNAISHIYSRYYKSGKQENLARACNHFKRGALDLYKIIVKDFFILQEQNKSLDQDNSIQKELHKIRAKEYGSIGNDMARLDFFNRYRLLAEKIIKTIRK